MSAYPGQEGLRDPLKVARGLGASRSGVRPWWLQRVTAVALVPLSIWFLFLMGGVLHADYPTVLGTIAHYVHTRWLAMTLQIALRFGAMLGALAGVMAILAVWLTGAGYY